MINTVKGIIIRRREITESSLVLTVFSDRAGKLSLLAKGARRPRSPFLGRAELFSLCGLTYYESRRRGLNILSDSVIIDPLSELRKDIRCFEIASSLSRLVDLGVGGSHGIPGMFELLKDTLAALPACPGPEMLRRFFEFRLLSLLGYSINWISCTRCGGRAFPLRSFSAAAGGMLCPGCAAKRGDRIAVSAGTHAILKSLDAGTLELAGRIKAGRSQSAELEAVSRRALAYHLEFNPRPEMGLATAVKM